MKKILRNWFLVIMLSGFTVVAGTAIYNYYEEVAVPSAVISEMISPQKISWTPSGPATALIDCSKVEKLCITFEKIRVNKTPNDGGDKEEWKIYFKPTEIQINPNLVTDTGAIISGVVGFFIGPYEIEVDDNIGEGADFEYPGKDYEVNGKFCLPGMYYKFITFAGGKEEDLLNPDDSIPEVQILTYNTCTTPENDPIPSNGPNSHAGNTLVVCEWDSDIDRYACYYFRASYQ